MVRSGDFTDGDKRITEKQKDSRKDPASGAFNKRRYQGETFSKKGSSSGGAIVETDLWRLHPGECTHAHMHTQVLNELTK